MSRRWANACALITLLASTGWAQVTERASVGSTGTQGNADSSFPSISIDGRYVAFHSQASNLVSGDTNGDFDVFVRDRQTGTTQRVSVTSTGVQGNGDSLSPSISADGRYVAFHSEATNFAADDTNGTTDVFVHDRQTGTTERVSVSASGDQGASDTPSISADGRYVAFFSGASTLVVPDTNHTADIFVCDRLNGTFERVSDPPIGQANDFSAAPSISADGRYVAYFSYATNLVADDTNMSPDVFVHDRQSGTVERVNLSPSGAQGGEGHNPSISADGRYVAFDNDGGLVPGSSVASIDIFVRDRTSATTEHVSVSSSGTGGNLASLNPSISADGRYVAFQSVANDLVPGDTNGWTDAFVHDRLRGVTERVSVDTGGTQGNNNSRDVSISAGGRFIAFTSDATNLITGDTNARKDVFVRDLGPAAPFSFCFGDGSIGACPCDVVTWSAGHGCPNSTFPVTAGAILGAAGSASLSADTLVLTSSEELPTALSIFAQGDATIPAVFFGDGLRCVGGELKRLYVTSAVAGVAAAPQGGDPSVSARSAALGDPIPLGASRFYFTYYRDASPVFCPDPPGNTFNASNALAITWAQ